MNSRYDAFGNTTIKLTSVSNKYLFTGEQFDSDLGSYYLRQRYYAQALGRFTTVDPFEGWQEKPISRHRYIYGNANPIMYSDPSGKVSTAAETNIVFAILGALQKIYIAYQGARLLFGDGGSPLPKIIWKGSMEISALDSSRFDRKLETGTPLDNMAKVELEFFFAKATATSDTGKIWTHNIWAVGGGLQVAAQNPEDKVVNRSLDFEVVTDRIYGDGPSSLKGLFGIGTAAFPNKFFRKTLGVVRIGNGSGTIGYRDMTKPDTVFGAGIYGGYSGIGR
ncbi:RHS repeat-associated core domain-containing protein [Leptolyngbya sp. GGD]|uniref:RHS repeat-associated core domain-containing protein n=1 Tax=Leptolyngbya sp. GGD TaxID=2997907 RepID=UPI00227A735A|nr:RHS repeat-associated core domain-containing protein [Leptolyngbya sp. GGD]MCY6493935.1 RHS repeat-associated core domain-containing protein [Leptolyngbya sp. GGD]